MESPAFTRSSRRSPPGIEPPLPMALWLIVAGSDMTAPVIRLTVADVEIVVPSPCELGPSPQPDTMRSTAKDISTRCCQHAINTPPHCTALGARHHFPMGT